MAISNIVSHQSGDTLTICISKKFDFDQHQHFRDAYRGKLREIRRYIVDLGSVGFMDSAALGMLLLLYKEATGQNSEAVVTLANAQPSVRKLLEIARFQEIFQIG